jgi:L-arabinose isomerase
VARAVWAPRPNLPTSAEAWLTAGAPHHTAFSAAVDVEILTDLAEMTGIELLVIDGDTNLRDFAKEIRFNQAYFRLAAGL